MARHGYVKRVNWSMLNGLNSSRFVSYLVCLKWKPSGISKMEAISIRFASLKF